MPRRGVALVATLLALPVLVACGESTTDPGEMSHRTYRSLEAREDLTLRDVEQAGGIESDDLERTFVSEGGSPAVDAGQCRYARVLYLRTVEEKQYRGTARFCFDADGRAVSVERHRPDITDAPAG